MANLSKSAFLLLLPFGMLAAPLGVSEAFAQADASLVTGSVRPATRTSTPALGSVGFQSTMALLSAGNAAEAYRVARALPDDMERRTIQWAAIRFGEGQVDFASIQRFTLDAPHFESSSVYRIRIEQALTKTDPTSKTIIDVLGGQMPNSLDAQILLAEAYVQDGQKARAARIARAIWIDNFLTKQTEASMLAALSTLLTNADHWDRAVHLLMHDRASGAERLTSYLTPAQKSLVAARIAVARKSKNAQLLIDKVDPSLRTHPLFHFTRAQFARDNGDLSTAVAFLADAKGNFPDAAEFWYERRLIIRRALANGQYDIAYKAAAEYTEGPEGRLVEAHFHAGWVALSFLKDAARARGHFEQMLSLSTLPDSVTQANFWLGRSLTALGDKQAAENAFRAAAGFATSYYGQLSREELGQKGVDIRPLPQWRASEATFEQIELVRAIRLLAANKKFEYAQTLLRRLAYSIDEPGHYVLAARLAQEVNAHHIAILIADAADRKGIPLDLFLFPKDGIPSHAKLANINASAVYAIARQESKFDVDAISSVGARGLMQLMPATAKEVAGKLGISYSADKLTSDAAYNTLLGSTYLATQLERYDGSLVLAAAAYNAGAGNVNKWLKAYGDPRLSSADPISWIEAIPFVETRKYVQRVMGNYLVYTARLGHTPITMNEALRRIPN